jgi:hypothetical protein
MNESGLSNLAKRGLLQLASGLGKHLLRPIADGGTRFQRIVFTDNQKVMLSVTDGGKTVRMNLIFSRAPEEVLHAIGAFFAGPTTAKGKKAKQILQEYVKSKQVEPEPGAPPPVRKRRGTTPRPADLPLIAQMQAEFDAINARHFGGSLPSVPIRISDRMRGRNGHFQHDPPEIAISRLLFTTAVAGEAEHTMRHEMIHLWQWATGARPGHGSDFRRWARAIGVHPRACRTVERKA